MKNLHRLLLTALLLLPGITRLQAQQSVWRRLDGPYGGMVSYFITAPNGDLYSWVEGAGMIRSRDDGGTWEWFGSGDGIPGIDARPVLVTRGGSIFATTGAVEGIYRSTDDGATWDQASGGAALDVNPGFMAETASGAIIMSTDAGIIRSTDDGEMWMRTSIPSYPLTFPVAAPDGLLYAASGGDGLFRSSDDGLTWKEVGNMVDRSVNAILFLPGDTMLVGTDNGIFASTDRGDSLAPIALSRRAIGMFALARTPAGDILATTYGHGLYRINSSGEVEVEGEPNDHLSGLAVTRTGKIVLGYEGRGILRSSDDGRSFQSVGVAQGAQIIRMVKGLDGGIYVGAKGEGLLRTSDDGITWTSLGLSEDALEIAFAPGGTIFVVGSPGGMFRSTDDGTTWSRIDVGAGTKGHNVFTTTIGIVLLQTDHGMFRSTDNGTSWRVVDVGEGRSLIAEAPNGDLYVIAVPTGSGAMQLFHSADNGATWSKRNLTGPAALLTEHAIQVPADGVLLVAGGTTGTAAIVRSTDNGATWTGVPLDCRAAYSIIAGSGGALFANTSCGIYRSIDLGSTWSRIAPLPAETEWHGDLVIDNMGKAWYGGPTSAYIGTFTTGVRADHEQAKAQGALRLFPNPSHGRTTIAFDLGSREHVTLTLRTLLGETVATITDRPFDAGSHAVTLDRPVPSGSYVIELKTGRSVSSTVVQIVE